MAEVLGRGLARGTSGPTAVASAGGEDASRRPVDWRLRLPEPHRRPLQAWFWSIAAVTFAVVLIGGTTRLTQSGLSIVDWQPLIGVLPPVTDAQWLEAFDRYRQFPEFRQLRQAMTLGEFKYIFFWEYLHRLVARLIGLVFLVPFALFWRAGYLPHPLLVRSLGLFALGGVQGLMGWLMVKSGLVDQPSVSHYRLAAHLALAFVILGVAIWLAHDVAIRQPSNAEATATRRPIVRGLTIIGLLLGAQIVWGALVAGLDAGLVYSTFPLMAGRVTPPAGLALDPLLLNVVQNIATVQWIHRVLGTLLLVATSIFAWRVRRSACSRPTRRFNRTFASLVALQYLVGVLTLLWRVPVGLGILHQAIAVITVAVWISWMHRLCAGPRAPRSQPA